MRSRIAQSREDLRAMVLHPMSNIKDLTCTAHAFVSPLSFASEIERSQLEISANLYSRN
jgi:hypothetical protein